MAGDPSDLAFLRSAPWGIDPRNQDACEELLARLARIRTTAAAAGPGPARSPVVALSWVVEARLLGRLQRLPRAFEAALNAVRERPPNDREVHVEVEECLGDLFSRQGDHEGALAAYGRALPNARPEQIFRMRARQAAVLRRLGRVQEAAGVFDEILEETPIPDGLSDDIVAAVLMNAASCDWQVGRPDLALARLSEAEQRAPRSNGLDLAHWGVVLRAWIHASIGEGERAWSAARGVILQRHGDVELRSSAARLLAGLVFGEEPDEQRPRVPVRRLEAPELGARQEEALTLMGETLAEAKADGILGAQLDLHRELIAAATLSGDLRAEVEHRRAREAIEQRLSSGSREFRERREALLVELATRRAELDRLQAREQLLAEANATLAAVDADRVRLLRTVAHDLRGPLTVLLGSVDLADPDDPESTRETLEAVAEASTRMAELLEQAMSAESILTGQATLAPRAEPLDEIIAAAARTFLPLAEARGRSIEVRLEQGMRGCVDRSALSRIVENLVANALKHAPEGDAIEVRGHLAGGTLEVAVVDNGPGFSGLTPTDGLLYGQQLANAEGQRPAGSGIGLHTVYQLTSRQGGVVELGNRAQGGARVRVRLPVGGAAP